MRLQSLVSSIAIWTTVLGTSLADRGSPRCRLVRKVATNSEQSSTVAVLQPTTSTTQTSIATTTLKQSSIVAILPSTTSATQTGIATTTITITASRTIVTSTIYVSVTDTVAQPTTVTTTTTTPTVTSTATTTETTTFSLNTQTSTVTVPTPAGFTPLGLSLARPTDTRRKRGLDGEQKSPISLSPRFNLADSIVSSTPQERRNVSLPPPRFHLPESFLHRIGRRAESDALAQSSVSTSTPAVITVTVAGGTSITVVTSTTTITPTGTRTSTVTVTATPTTITSTSTVLKRTTLSGTATSTSSYYAACATNNLLSTIDGHPIAGYDPISDPGTFLLKSYGSDYDCCVTAMNTANSVFWFRSHQTNACWVYSENTCPASAWRGWIVTGSCSVCREQYTAGNSKCGSVVNEAFTGELDVVG